ncbi:MAG: exosortase-associated protein EpsI, B-type [Rhizobacter sp.]
MNIKAVSWLAGLAMMTCAALANTWHPTPIAQQDFNLEALIPAQFGGWRVDRSMIPIAPTPDVQESLDKLYGQIVSRTYVNDRGERMMLVVAYGGDQSDSLKAHRQEVCYAAQGFAIREVHRDSLTLPGGEVPLVRVHAQKGTRSEPLSYWFTMGDRVVIGRAERLFSQIGYGLAGKIPDGLLVRVSSISRDVPASYAAQDDFMRGLLGALTPQTRRQLAGLAGA